MLASVFQSVAVMLVLISQGLALPVAQPAHFETDPMLQVGEKSASSYAQDYKKRAIFETDPMLQVGEHKASSYADNSNQDSY